MHNYHLELIWAVDKVLLCIIALTALVTILYVIIKEYRFKRRSRALWNIKRNVYKSVLAGNKADNICLPVVSEITPEQFLDVATNRNREIAFFNEAEQKILKSCFVSKEKLKQTAKSALFSWNKWRRIEAILALGYAQAVQSLDTLKKTLNDNDLDISYFSIIALGQIKDVASARIMLDFAKRKFVFPYRMFSLLESFPPEIADEVIKLTDSINAEVRSWAIRLICRLRALKYSKRTEELISDKSPVVRAAACECLGEFGSKDSAKAIGRCLTDESWMVRVSAMETIFKILGKDALADIMGMINDGSLSVIESLKALISENIGMCLPYVENFLYGSDEMARRVAVESLEASGYIVRLFRDILSGYGKPEKKHAHLLKGLIVARAYTGLEASLLIFSADERKKLLDVIKVIDPSAGDILENGIINHKA